MRKRVAKGRKKAKKGEEREKEVGREASREYLQVS